MTNKNLFCKSCRKKVDYLYRGLCLQCDEFRRKAEVISPESNTLHLKIFTLKSVMLFVGVIFTIFSIYFTRLYFELFFDSIQALFLSMGFVLFVVVGFSVCNELRKSRKIVMAFVFFLMLVFAMLFSMTTSIFSYLTKNQINDNNSEIIKIENNNTLYENFETQINDLKNDKNKNEIERDILLNMIKEKKVMDKEYKELHYRLYLIKNKINTITDKIEKLEDQRNNLLINQQVLSRENLNDSKDFFGYLSVIFGINKQVIKFVLFSIPAVLLDVLSAISFLFVLDFKVL